MVDFCGGHNPRTARDKCRTEIAFPKRSGQTCFKITFVLAISLRNRCNQLSRKGFYQLHVRCQIIRSSDDRLDNEVQLSFPAERKNLFEMPSAVLVLMVEMNYFTISKINYALVILSLAFIEYTFDVEVSAAVGFGRPNIVQKGVSRENSVQVCVYIFQIDLRAGTAVCGKVG